MLCFQTPGLAEEFHFMQSRAVYCTEDSGMKIPGEETETGDTRASEQKKWAGGFTIQGRWTEARINPEHRPQPVRRISCSDWAAIWIWLPRKTRERGYDGTGSGTENWKPSREAESFYITFDDEGLAEVTWINPCIVEGK